MSYDSDASFDITPASFTSEPPAAAPESPASAALVAEAAVAMAVASQQHDFRADGGWDAPPPPAMSTSQAFTAGTAGTAWSDDDDGGPDDDWDNRGGTGRRQLAVNREGQVLRDVALRAYTLHPDACHQSTAEVAHHFGRSELDGQSANAQVATLRAQWREVSGARAEVLAARGVLVVAGLAGEGNAGHTAIVVAGPSVELDGQVYPSVCGGGLPMRRSDGTRLVVDTWTPRERVNVHYFTPETRSWLGRLFSFS